MRTEVAKLFSELPITTKNFTTPTRYSEKEYVLVHYILIYLIFVLQKARPVI